MQEKLGRFRNGLKIDTAPLYLEKEPFFIVKQRLFTNPYNTYT